MERRYGRGTMTTEAQPDFDGGWLQFATNALADLGFDLVGADRTHGDAIGHLLVAIRPQPTEEHFDPESIDYWITDGSRGRAARIDADARFPIASRLSWGSIMLTDRLGVFNEFLTFGGTVRARVAPDGTIVSDFASPAPFLRSSGHSIEHDPVAAELEAFFARLKVPIDFVPGSESLIARTSPLALYSAFIQGIRDRLAQSPGLRSAEPWLVGWCSRETAHMEHDPEWPAGTDFRTQLAALEAGARE
jgi:hypothetical protein